MCNRSIPPARAMAAVNLDVATNAGPPPSRTVPSSPSSKNGIDKVRHDDEHYDAAPPHALHEKILLGLTAVTIALVILWIIMFWAPESNDEAYQSVVVSSA
jgi:hypothetical protein